MLITLKASRIYASDSQFGPSPRNSLQAEPFVLSDYPVAGERALVSFGAPVESILSASKVRAALANFILTRAFTNMAGSADNPDLAIEKKLRSMTPPSALTSANWYISIIIERDVDISDEFMSVKKFMWLDPQKAMELERDFLPHATECCDVLSSYLTTLIEPIFFERLAMTDRVFFFSAGREPFGMPTIHGGSAGVSITRSINALDLPRIEQRLRSFASGSPQRHAWLNTLSHWRLAALQENDPLRSFLWAFLALEILTHKMAQFLHAEVITNALIQPAVSLLGSSSSTALSELIVPNDQLTLKAKFALLALALSPATADQDVATFAAAKKARDRFSHGDITDIQELPGASANSLLQKYFVLSITHQIGE
jgi:hypothetical protein